MERLKVFGGQKTIVKEIGLIVSLDEAGKFVRPGINVSHFDFAMVIYKYIFRLNVA